VNLGEQYLTKELIQLKEQADEMMKSEIMQKRVQDDSARMEEMEKSGWRSRLEQIEEQIRSVAPQFFPNIKEKVIEVTEAISEPDTEPETHKEKVLKAKEVYQRMAQEPHDNFFNFETQWQCADEYRYRTDEGDFDTYMDAYRYAVKHCLADDKPIPSPERLVKAYKRAKDNCCLLKSQPDGYWNK